MCSSRISTCMSNRIGTLLCHNATSDANRKANVPKWINPAVMLIWSSLSILCLSLSFCRCTIMHLWFPFVRLLENNWNGGLRCYLQQFIRTITTKDKVKVNYSLKKNWLEWNKIKHSIPLVGDWMELTTDPLCYRSAKSAFRWECFYKRNPIPDPPFLCCYYGAIFHHALCQTV